MLGVHEPAEQFSVTEHARQLFPRVPQALDEEPDWHRSAASQQPMEQVLESHGSRVGQAQIMLAATVNQTVRVFMVLLHTPFAQTHEGRAPFREPALV